MATQQRSDLYDQFVSGTAATEDKFVDLIDSSYNRRDDSVLLGPTGSTGLNGLIGPSGATFYNGLFLSSSSVPSGPTASGMTGEVVIDTGSDFLYICGGSYWVRVTCNSSF